LAPELNEQIAASEVHLKIKILNILRKVLYLSILAASISAVVNPSLRELLQDYFQPDSRKILSFVIGDLLNNGKRVKVLKVRENRELFLEIYSLNESENSSSLLEKIPLFHNRDGFFTFNGESSNLALDDIDGDEIIEILAPSFDNNFAAYLNIFHYNPELNRFEKYKD